MLWVFQIVFLNDFYKLIKTEELKKYSDTLFKINTSELPEYLKLNEPVSDTGVMVFNIDKNLIAIQEIDRFYFIYNMTAVKINSLYNFAVSSGGVYIDTYIFGDRKNNDSIKPKDEKSGYNKTQGNGEADIIQHNLDIYLNMFEYAPYNDLPDIRMGMFPNIKRGEPLSKYDGVECILYCRASKNSAGDDIFVILTSFIQPVDATAETLTFQLIIITVILIMLSLIMAKVISDRISAPIIALNNSAKTLSSGEFKKYNSGVYKEIDELGDTLQCAAEEISKVDELRKELIANVSHDLRTPLTLISGYSEVMRDIPGENTAENLQIVIDEAKRLNNLVTDMLNISKLENGMDKANKENFSLTELTKEILYRYKKLIDNDGYKIDYEYEGEAIVNADPTKISQVIYNLVNNAINYCGEDKTVIVKQVTAGGFVRLEVIDHGSGIEQSKIPLIWDRYYKVENANMHKRANVGSGLGLSIVKKVLLMHDAKFGVESKLGEGSTFWFEMKME